MSKKAYGLGPDPEATPSAFDKIKLFAIMFLIFGGAIIMGFVMFTTDEAIIFALFMVAIFIIVLVMNAVGNKLAGKFHFEIDGETITKYNNNKVVGQNNIKASTFELQKVGTGNDTFDYYLIVTEGNKEPVRYSSVMIGRTDFSEFMNDLNELMEDKQI